MRLVLSSSSSTQLTASELLLIRLWKKNLVYNLLHFDESVGIGRFLVSTKIPQLFIIMRLVLSSSSSAQLTASELLLIRLCNRRTLFIMCCISVNLLGLVDFLFRLRLCSYSSLCGLLFCRRHHQYSL